MTTLAEPKTCVITRGRKCITAKYTDGTEIVEEFDVITDDLLLRKSRTKNTFGGFSEWEVEVGSEAVPRNLNRDLLVVSSGNPELVSQDTKQCHVFRIRNLPYPRDVFSVTVEHKDEDPIGEIVVRTTNKKYFKRIRVPVMVRARIPLDPAQLSFDVKNNTLIVEYKKHPTILAAEAQAEKERSSMAAKRVDEENKGCEPQ